MPVILSAKVNGWKKKSQLKRKILCIHWHNKTSKQWSSLFKVETFINYKLGSSTKWKLSGTCISESIQIKELKKQNLSESTSLRQNYLQKLAQRSFINHKLLCFQWQYVKQDILCILIFIYLFFKWS